MTRKRWIHSKTIFFNSLVALLSVLATETDYLSALLPPRTFAAVMLTTALINVLLRCVTTTALAKPRKKP